MIGRTLSHYKILEEINRGGMGVVYRAVDVKLDREVALKLLPPELVADPERKRRFILEAKAAAKLEHPNIATVYEIDEADGVTFIVMELIHGKNLHEAVKGDRLPVSRALELATEVAEGLACAHGKGIVHRDLKPANIILTEHGHAKIIDFGLAKLVEPLAREGSDVETTLRRGTAPGTVMGTVDYMSPEQARGETVDHRSDVFTFGTVFHEMLAGVPPFHGRSSADTLSAILNKPPPRLEATLAGEMTPELERIRDKCLTKDPVERYQSMPDVEADLRAMRRSLDSKFPKHPHSRIRFYPAIVGLLIVAVVTAYYFLARQPMEELPAGGAQPKRIVVLPFENMGPPEEAYFADGTTEEITSRLAGVKELAVISRTSAVQYQGSGKTIQQIGEELSVDYALEGSVRWQRGSEGGDRVRVTCQLIRVVDDTHLWSDSYDRVLEDIFAVQSDIAEQVSQQLGITLLEKDRNALRAESTQNLDAYEAYLRGLSYDRGPDSMTRLGGGRSVEMFERAVRLDPGFAVAHARLSIAHGQFYFQGHDRTSERVAMAKKEVEQAFELQPDLPLAHLAMGYYYYWGHRDYHRALQWLTSAQEGMPSSSEIFAAIAYIRRRQGAFEESIRILDKAIELDPRASSFTWNQGYSYLYLREYREAERYFDHTISMAPDEGYGYSFKALNRWLWRGDSEGAGSVLEAMPESPDAMAMYFVSFHRILQKNYREALEQLNSISDEVMQSNVTLISRNNLLAQVHSLMGETELARAAFGEARAYLESELEKVPEDARLHSALGIAYAGLGMKEEAIQEGELGVQLLPISEDALAGPYRIDDLISIYTLVGEHAKALDQVKYLLSKPSHWSAHLVEADPRLDPLREHPRYQQIIEEYQ